MLSILFAFINYYTHLLKILIAADAAFGTLASTAVAANVPAMEQPVVNVAGVVGRGRGLMAHP